MASGEVVSFMIGQCGVQTGYSCWSLYGEEHGISPYGTLVDSTKAENLSFNAFYNESQNFQFVPRTLFIDLEPSVIDEVRNGPSRSLFHANTLITTCEDSSNNFARGFYTCGRLLIKEVVFATRKQVEACNSLRCFVVHHSYGGGTGSGFMSLLLEYLMADYGKITKIDLGLIPNETLACSTVESYNAVLGLHHPMESTDLGILYENEPIYKICKTKLYQKYPTFPHLNQIVSQLMSGVTACTRFESTLGCSLVDLQTNIVPYPRIHFPLVSYAPIGSALINLRSSLSTTEITNSAFHSSNQLVSVDAEDGRVMACCLLFRGPVSSQEAFKTVFDVKKNKNMKWVDWCPTGIKIGISTQPLSISPQSYLSDSLRSVTILKNSTVVRNVFSRLGQKFLQLFSRKAFVHWFVSEGMEEKELQEAFDDVMMLSSDMSLLEKGSDEVTETELTQLYTKPKTEADEVNDNHAVSGQ